MVGDLRLDELHTVLQAGFDWEDAHLHQFEAHIGGAWHEVAGDDARGLDPFDVPEQTSLHEAELRLDQLVTSPGDQLRYLYDFGDSWQIVIRLEAVSPAIVTQDRARVVARRRAAPPEDFGGIFAYNDVAYALEHGELDNEWRSRLDDIGPLTPAEFNLDRVDRLVRQAAARHGRP